MKYLTALAFALAFVGAQAQNTTNNATDFASGLLAALRQNNLTQLATAVEANAEDLLPLLSSPGNKTVLAPSNQALQSLGNVDNDDLVALISYHVLNGTYTNQEIANGSKTIVSSGLRDDDYVDLPGNRSQVVVLGRQANNNTVYIQQAGRNVSFANTTDGPVYQNILVQPIASALQLPNATSQVATALGASQLAQLLQTLNLVEGLDDATVTVFAPTNAAIQAVQADVQAATPEQQRSVLLNHILNGTVVYSSQLADTPSATSGSGNQLTFMSNDTGAFVTTGNTTARIISSDNIAKNGVVHVIDAVLLNTTENAEAASAAASSNAAAQATQTSEPGVSSGGNEGGGNNAGGGAENSSSSLPHLGVAAAAFTLIASGICLLV